MNYEEDGFILWECRFRAVDKDGYSIYGEKKPTRGCPADRGYSCRSYVKWTTFLINKYYMKEVK